MGKLSTGQNFGEVVGAEDSARLLGGIAEIAPAGVIGNAELPTAPVRPAATQVNTFQPSGAPTLGGKQFVFDRPKLPESNKDAARLAQSLSSFNSNLSLIAQDLEQAEKIDIAVDKKAGVEAAAKLQTGGYLSIADAIAKTEELSKTDASRLPLLNELKGLGSGRKLRFANEAFSNSNLIGALSSTNTIISQTKFLPDGRALESVSPDDPAYKAFVDALMVPVGTSGESLAANASLRASMYQVTRQAQSKRYAEYNDNTMRNGFNRGSQGIATGLVQGLEDPTAGAGKISKYFDEVYATTSPDVYRETVQNYTNLLANQINALIKDKPGAEDVLANAELNAILMLKQITTGPNKAPLLNQLPGGEQVALLAFSRSLRKGQDERIEQADKIRKRETEDFVNNNIVDALKRVDRNDPAAMSRQITTLQNANNVRFANDPEGLKIAQQALNPWIKSLTDTSEVVQGEAFARMYAAPAVGTQASIDKIKNMAISKEITVAQATQLITREQTEMKVELKPFVDLKNRNKKSVEKFLNESYGRTGGGVSVEENIEVTKVLINYEREAQEIIDKGGPDRMIKLGQLFVKTLKPMTNAATAQQQANKYPTIMDAANDIGTRSRTLNAQFDRKNPKAIYDKAGFGKHLDNYLSGQPQPQVFTNLFNHYARINKNLTMKEFIQNQAEAHGTQMVKGVPYIVPDAPQPSIPVVPAPTTQQQSPATQQQQQQQQSSNPQAGGFGMTGMGTAERTKQRAAALWNIFQNYQRPGGAFAANNLNAPTTNTTMAGTTGSNSLAQVIRDLKGAESFRGTKQIKFKQRGDYQSSADENFFFDFNPSLVPLALKRAASLSQNDINALAFTALTEAGPTAKGKLEVMANLINRSAAKSNAPIVDIAKAPNQYEGVFGYTKAEVISQAKGQQLFGSRYTQLRTQLMGGN